MRPRSGVCQLISITSAALDFIAAIAIRRSKILERGNAVDGHLYDVPFTNCRMLQRSRLIAKAWPRTSRWRWTRVYTLPDYVFFDHSIHIAKGVGCTGCHGPIGDMPLDLKAQTLYMSRCLSCHRDPAPHLRPKDEVFNPHWQRTQSTSSGQALMAQS